MKKTFIELLERPKVIIPLVLVIAVIVGAVSYNFIGQTPVVNLVNDSNLATSTIESAVNSIGLSFNKSGRLSTTSVNIGSFVKKGDVLASLDAGDSLGLINQTKGALELAKAQYSSLNVQYTNVKKQQDTIVANAYKTLLSSNLIAVAHRPDYDKSSDPIDNNQVPQISGSYSCDKNGSYEIQPYASGAVSGYSFNFKGLEEGTGNITFYNPQPFGSCGLQIQFPVGYYSTSVKWVIDIPNTKSPSYIVNKNAYDLAVSTRDQVLKQFEANLGENGVSDANISKASIDSAQGAYETALASYQNSLIIAPVDGIVTFIDPHLKVGQSVSANKTVITIIKKYMQDIQNIKNNNYIDESEIDFDPTPKSN